MTEYIEEKQEVAVPPATGIPGLLKVVAGILERPRIQEIILAKGKITYRRFRREDEEVVPLGIELDTLMPSVVIRNGSIEELVPVSANAAVVVGQMFAKAHMDGMNPIAWVSGIASQFPSWHARSTNVVLGNEVCYGLPFLRDAGLPDEAIILCTAYSRRASLPDVVRSYKVTVPLLKEIVKT